MFSIFKKDKSKLYLGELYVAPRKGIKKIDEWGLFESARLEDNIRMHLEQLICLEKLTDAEELKSFDLAIDIAIPDYQGGNAGIFSLRGITLPYFWRPKVTVSARVYNAQTGKTLYTLKQSAKMPFSPFLQRQLTLRGIFALKPSFDIDDVLPLLYQACLTLLVNVKAKSKL